MKTTIFLFISLFNCINCIGQQKKEMDNKKDSIISEQKAIEIATLDAVFLGTWVSAELKNGLWNVTAFSKSAHPPMYYIVDAKKGTILLKLDNSDDPQQQKKLKQFLSDNKGK